MIRTLSIVLLGLVATACSNTVARGPGDAELARAQLLAIADNPQATTFEGLDAPRVGTRAICGRMNDAGSPKMPVRFFLEPLDKRVLLDPASSLPAAADKAAADCKRARRDRSLDYSAREAICRPAEVLRREANLRKPFERRFTANCG